MQEGINFLTEDLKPTITQYRKHFFWHVDKLVSSQWLSLEFCPCGIW